MPICSYVFNEEGDNCSQQEGHERHGTPHLTWTEAGSYWALRRELERSEYEQR